MEGIFLQKSSIPCNRCNGVVHEFSIPNDIWNYVIRVDGKERDDEYICIDCWHNALRAKIILTELTMGNIYEINFMDNEGSKIPTCDHCGKSFGDPTHKGHGEMFQIKNGPNRNDFEKEYEWVCEEHTCYCPECGSHKCVHKESHWICNECQLEFCWFSQEAD